MVVLVVVLVSGGDVTFAVVVLEVDVVVRRKRRELVCTDVELAIDPVAVDGTEASVVIVIGSTRCGAVSTHTLEGVR